ncbi:lysozyme [Brevundimonas phage vB_BpoS-Papperlapapp]|uniref:Lysozyme n=2 Tax=Marchewkavirus TaxID=3425052 RepID=A0A9E7MP12_9CAUD|nr:lysozyme [Brevundimonas phage vB_BpoS-Kabachok]USN14916.1 lysozyme [Brevundimonas phage vB_BpoS-Domovoi]USN16289.1 lysozyme [Brevundimonas phage vB_BpoS-Papperlapapp]
MQISSEGLKLIQSTEQFEAEPYYCSAHVSTIGWGHALTTPSGQIIDYDIFGRARADQLTREAMQRMFGKQRITVAEADALLTDDLKRYVAEVNRIADARTYQGEFDAMVSMCFNIGTAGFRSSAVARLHAQGARKVGNISMSGLAAQSKAKAEPVNIQIAFARWSNANGKWALGLYRRRLAELMVYGGHPAAQSLQTAWSYR